jgi:Zn finger protein HypA/HybF involved in hydrogenase expression
MHERGIVEDLMSYAESLCDDQPGRAIRVNLTVGALSGVDPRYVSDYVKLLIRDGSPLASAEFVINVSDDISDPGAGSVRIDSVAFEDK